MTSIAALLSFVAPFAHVLRAENVAYLFGVAWSDTPSLWSKGPQRL